ncbi:MAG: hypothetical protein K6G61_11795 [Solobacterium sp.]|nr:hypothetical protein [Solobacterium sp.]
MKKLLSVLLALLIAAGMMPLRVMAEETGEEGETFESGKVKEIDVNDDNAYDVAAGLLEDSEYNYCFILYLNGGSVNYDEWMNDCPRYVSKDGNMVLYLTEILDHSHYDGEGVPEMDEYGEPEWDTPWVFVFEPLAQPSSTGLYKAGYKFAGWYQYDDFSDEKNSFTHEFTGGIYSDYLTPPEYAEYYAKWVPDTSWKPGWRKTSDGWRYAKEAGKDYRDGVYKIGTKYYGFDGAGYMVRGWKKFSGKWYYFASSGEAVTGWKKLSGKWYWFTSEGKMVTGWKKISGKWYYFNGSGAMLTGWQKISKKWYYFLSGGAMVTGWKKIGAKWYYFQSSGVMKTGWLKLGGKWYYLKSSGEMLTGTMTIGPRTYIFNSSGVCQNP